MLPSHPLRLSHPHFPNSPVLPGCQGNRSCQARSPRKPRARLFPPSPSLACPPHPKQQRCGGWEGQWRRRTRTPAPERGAQTYLRSGDPHPKPTSSTPQLDTQRPPDVHPPPDPSPGSCEPPNTELAWLREPPPGYFPHPLRLSIRPRPLSSAAAPHPGGGLRPLSPN